MSYSLQQPETYWQLRELPRRDLWSKMCKLLCFTGLFARENIFMLPRSLIEWDTLQLEGGGESDHLTHPVILVFCNQYGIDGLV